MPRTIEIDFDVHKAIEAERRSFDDTDNDVLRRLLGRGKATGAGHGISRNILGEDRPAWSGKGVVLPHGTQVRMTHRGIMHEGSIQDGKWAVGSHRGTSPSAAACAVTGTSVNGWPAWEVRRPGDQSFIPLRALRN